MPDPAAELRTLVAEFYEVWFRFHPAAALALGEPVSGTLLPPLDDDERGALASWLETLILALDELDFGALDPVCSQDVALLTGAVRIEHRELIDLDWRRRDPLGCLPLEGLHALILQPGRDLRPRLAGLLAAIPDHLRDAQALLSERAPGLARPLVQAAVREADCGRRYLDSLARGPWLRQHCHGLPEIQSLIDAAGAALADYRELLRTEIAPRARGPVACGRGHLAERLSALHLIAVDPDACRGALARALDGVETALAGLRAGAGPADDPDLGALGPACERLRDDIVAAGLVTLPPAPIAVHRVPACPETWGARIDYRVEAAGGALYISAPSPSPVAEPAKTLAGCLERGWGGTHLLSWADPERAGRLPRRLAHDASLRVGLGLFLESRLAAAGGPARRRVALGRQRELLRLGLMDLDLHAPGAGALPDPAVDQDPLIIARLASAPGDAAAAAIGWLCLETAARRLGARAGTSPRALLDGLVRHGTVPLGLAVRAEHGEGAWSGIVEETLGS
jgi:hypothetical protein